MSSKALLDAKFSRNYINIKPCNSWPLFKFTPQMKCDLGKSCKNMNVDRWIDYVEQFRTNKPTEESSWCEPPKMNKYVDLPWGDMFIKFCKLKDMQPQGRIKDLPDSYANNCWLPPQKLSRAHNYKRFESEFYFIGEKVINMGSEVWQFQNFEFTKNSFPYEYSVFHKEMHCPLYLSSQGIFGQLFNLNVAPLTFYDALEVAIRWARSRQK